MKKILLVLLFILFISACTSSNNINGDTVNEEGFVTIPISSVTDSMQKYSYNANGVEVVYFTVLGSDGEIRTAFDACDVCGGYMGYKQQGEDVVCNKCGRVFNIDDKIKLSIIFLK